MACSILTASFAVLSSTSSPARAASSLTLTTGLLVAAVWNAVQHGANEWHGGLQPMTLMLEQNLLQMATAHDPSWIAMCDGFVRGTYDDCRWHTGWLTGRRGRLAWLNRVGGGWPETGGWR